ncbi:hypothetical protein KIPB_000801 [Kipferlia bialata]|uniref:Uncharacterized protein n=1 Tax=Kipferlia bialata TaxID=797122 RepID=A0A391NLG4_9EUKA|nr:hypothetical protein KIPB_000801 [Kipferlia bialata]|eukprot:g801.t1
MGRLSEKEILRLSGDFTLGSVYRLRASDMGITDISAVARCKRLLTLDLSGNKVADLSPLSKLLELTTLVLSHNLVCSLLPLAQCKSLRFVLVADNALASLDALEPLAGLPILRCVDVSGNPCVGDDLQAFVTSAMEVLPQVCSVVYSCIQLNTIVYCVSNA